MFNELIGMKTSNLCFPAGSKFRHPGLFEVKKTQDIPEEDRDDSGCPLTVRVSPDLDGYSRVRVTITDLREEGALTNSEGGDDIKMAKATASNEQNSESHVFGLSILIHCFAWYAL